MAREMDIEPRSLDGQYCNGSQKASVFKNLLNKTNYRVHIQRTQEENIQFIVIILLIVRFYQHYTFTIFKQNDKLYTDCIVRTYPILTPVTLFELALIIALRGLNTRWDYMNT